MFQYSVKNDNIFTVKDYLGIHTSVYIVLKDVSSLH